MEAAHSALDASMYRFLNVGLHFKNYFVNPQISGLIWSLCRDIESFVMTESSIFVAGFCHSMQFSIATGTLSFVLYSVTTDFDNVAT